MIKEKNGFTLSIISAKGGDKLTLDSENEVERRMKKEGFWR